MGGVATAARRRRVERRVDGMPCDSPYAVDAAGSVSATAWSLDAVEQAPEI